MTDNLTGLIWLEDANCTDTVGGIDKSSGKLTWSNGLDWSNNLAAGSCGLADGSVAGDWRLPNVFELESLRHMGFSNPALPDTEGTGQWSEGEPFTGVQSSFYWSATTNANDTSNAWLVSFDDGFVNIRFKTFTKHVWCVRGGS